jgi:hypothetical protein
MNDIGQFKEKLLPADPPDDVSGLGDHHPSDTLGVNGIPLSALRPIHFP